MLRRASRCHDAPAKPDPKLGSSWGLHPGAWNGADMAPAKRIAIGGAEGPTVSLKAKAMKALSPDLQ